MKELHKNIIIFYIVLSTSLISGCQSIDLFQDSIEAILIDKSNYQSSDFENDDTIRFTGAEKTIQVNPNSCVFGYDTKSGKYFLVNTDKTECLNKYPNKDAFGRIEGNSVVCDIKEDNTGDYNYNYSGLCLELSDNYFRFKRFFIELFLSGLILYSVSKFAMYMATKPYR